MGEKRVWCRICAKYLAFGTYPISTVGTLHNMLLSQLIFTFKFFYVG